MIPFEVGDIVAWTEKGEKEWPIYADVDRLEVADLDEKDRSLDIRVEFQHKGNPNSLWIHHSMITHVVPDEDCPETSNLAMYEKVFGITPNPHKCPSKTCDDCPVKYKKPSGGCDVEHWWRSEYKSEFSGSGSAVTKRPDVNPERKKTTLTGLAGLCEEYNASDYDGLTYIRDQALCTTPEQRDKLEKLLMLNDLLYTFNSENYSETTYRAQYIQLLKELGVSLDKDGNAYVKEKKEDE